MGFCDFGFVGCVVFVCWTFSLMFVYVWLRLGLFVRLIFWQVFFGLLYRFDWLCCLLFDCLGYCVDCFAVLVCWALGFYFMLQVFGWLVMLILITGLSWLLMWFFLIGRFCGGFGVYGIDWLLVYMGGLPICVWFGFGPCLMLACGFVIWYWGLLKVWLWLLYFVFCIVLYVYVITWVGFWVCVH